ncbi:hypothetical protein Emag_003107 [Eimeria magna]
MLVAFFRSVSVPVNISPLVFRFSCLSTSPSLLHFCLSLFLLPYSSGRTTGLVLDCGDGVSHAVPVVEGFALSHAITRADVAGRDVTEHLALLLRRAGHVFHTSAEYEVVRQIKEQACYVAFNPQKEEASSFEKSGGGFPMQLPDGTTISVGAERYRAPEILFHPSLIGLEYPGVHELIGTAISRADLDLRRTLYSQLVLAGVFAAAEPLKLLIVALLSSR